MTLLNNGSLQMTMDKKTNIHTYIFDKKQTHAQDKNCTNALDRNTCTQLYTVNTKVHVHVDTCTGQDTVVPSINVLLA